MNAQQAKQKLHHDRSREMRDFAASDSVSVRNIQGTYAKWIPGTVIRRLGPLTYLVRVALRLRLVHIDHLLQAHSVDNAEGVEPTLDEPTTVSQAAAREQQSVSPATTSQSCVSPATSSRCACLTRNRKRTHRCSVNVDIVQSICVVNSITLTKLQQNVSSVATGQTYLLNNISKIG